MCHEQSTNTHTETLSVLSTMGCNGKREFYKSISTLYYFMASYMLTANVINNAYGNFNRVYAMKILHPFAVCMKWKMGVVVTVEVTPRLCLCVFRELR